MRSNQYFFNTNIIEVVKNKELRSRFTFTYESTGNYYYTDGINTYSVEAFDRIYPIILKRIYPKGKNSDGTKSWINDDN